MYLKRLKDLRFKLSDFKVLFLNLTFAVFLIEFQPAEPTPAPFSSSLETAAPIPSVIAFV